MYYAPVKSKKKEIKIGQINLQLARDLICRTHSLLSKIVPDVKKTHCIISLEERSTKLKFLRASSEKQPPL